MDIRRLLPGLALAIALAALAPGVQAQQGEEAAQGAGEQEEQEEQPPQVLSSELALKTLLESRELEVNFVIVDSDDNVTEVIIDGERQEIEPADTVLVTRRFVFDDPVTRVQVIAKDEAGNARRVTYTVYAPGVDPEAAEEAARTVWFAGYDVRFELDDNPSQDLSAPIDIGGVELTGVVPDDEQDDTRTNVQASGGVSFGNLALFAGGQSIEYSDTANERFNVLTVYLGAQYTFALGRDSAFQLGYAFADVNLSEADYAQTHTVTPALAFQSVAADGDRDRHVVALDLSAKDFASDVQEDDTVFTFRWELESVDAEGLDRFRRTIALGSNTEGIEESEFDFITADFDWMNRWDSGLLWDIGFGVGYRDFPNDEPLTTDTILGDTRVDSPLRFSTGIGWQFIPELRAMFNYRYVFNVSNTSPFERQIYGISVNGRF